MKRLAWLALLAVLLLPCACMAQEGWTLEASGAEVELLPVQIEGETWAFLPAFADREVLFPSARETEEAGVWLADDGTHVMQSDLRALFLFSDDPVNQGRAYIENCERHANRATGSMALIAQDGTMDAADALRQIRGRGNGTWQNEKKPYQIKLETKADLLKTGLESEKARTWVLLAEAGDRTLLHNRLAYDLALELGMDTASHSEYVDLYYDGEYRGIYLLAEKVEIAEGRIDETDYEKLIERWNKKVGIADPEALDVGTKVNRYGQAYRYIDGLADSLFVNAGAYLLEMESPNGNTLNDRCWFRVDDYGYIALKNPENASQSMVLYISERLMEARQTLRNGGTHPENGRTIEDDFEIDGFARLALINELACNLDGFTWSSTFFILPAGEKQFQSGPPWDFDLAWRYLTDGTNAGGRAFKDREGWLSEFYGCEAFSDRMKAIWTEELYPLVQSVLLGDGRGIYLRSLDDYDQLTRAARRMNEKLWPEAVEDYRLVYADTYEADLSLLRTFITERSAWLNDVLTADRDRLDITLRVPYGHAADALDFWLPAWAEQELVSYTSVPIREATETEYAVYRVEAVFKAKDGQAFAQPSVTLNGTALPCEVQEDGTLRIAFSFTDPSYRPVWYEGRDVGLIFSAESYAERYPEIAEACGGDPERLLEHFMTEGMEQGLIGNAFFEPSRLILYNTDLASLRNEGGWRAVYDALLEYGYEEGWLTTMEVSYRPEVEYAP